MEMLCIAQGIGVVGEPDATLSPVESFDPGAGAKDAVTSLGVDLRRQPDNVHKGAGG